MTRTFILREPGIVERACAYLRSLVGVYEVIVKPHQDTRTSAQNRLMWELLHAIAKQVEWHGQRLSAENWKDIITAAIKRQQVVPGLDGGFVVLGTSTRQMKIAEMGEVIDCALAFGAQQGVRFESEEVA